MNKIELKSNIHSFIDQLDNVELLRKYYSELKSLVKGSKSKMWDNLSEDQKNEVLLSFDESESEKHLIDNDSIINRLKKKL